MTIPPARLLPWVANFRSRHGDVEAVLGPDGLRLTAADGAGAVIGVPFPPLAATADPVRALAGHVSVARRLGAVLVRKGGYAVGVFDGPRLVTSKVGSAYVQGRTKAGGWSQQRYARRRDNQSAQAYGEAADVAARLLLPERDGLVAVATGGDRVALAAVFDDPRLSALRPLLTDTVHAVPDPRLRVLQAFPEQFLALEVRLNALA